MVKRIIEDIIVRKEKTAFEQPKISATVKSAIKAEENPAPVKPRKAPIITAEPAVPKQQPKITETPGYSPPASDSGKKPFLKSRSGRKIIFIFFFVILAAVAGVKILDAVSRIVIQITPRQELIKVDSVVKAGNDKAFDLPLEAMEIDVTKQKSATATGIKPLEIKASGKIIVYNNYSTASQTLVKSTRFETPKGLIYRTDKSIVVPGMKTQNGKDIPGSVEVTVYADKPGEEYNTDPTDFTIPGFKGSPRYDKFFGRSSTPITGGFKGDVPAISDEDLKNMNEMLQSIVKEELEAKIKMQTPKDYILYDKAVKISYSENSRITNFDIQTKKFVLEKSGHVFAPLISKKELTNFLARKYLDKSMENKVEIADLDSLEFALLSLDDKNRTMSFNLKGEVKFIWLIDEAQLKDSLVASSKDVENVFNASPAIDRASIIFKPGFWKFFPKNKSKITIERLF